MSDKTISIGDAVIVIEREGKIEDIEYVGGRFFYYVRWNDGAGNFVNLDDIKGNQNE